MLNRRNQVSRGPGSQVTVCHEGSSVATRTRTRIWRLSDARGTAEVWRKALLEQGLTTHGKVQSEQRSAALQQGVADMMQRLHARKVAAASATRQLRFELSQELRSLGVEVPPATLTGSGQPSMELQRSIQRLDQRTRRQISDGWSKLQQLRRQRLWTIVVADVREVPAVPGEAMTDQEQPHCSLAVSGQHSDWMQAGYIMLSLRQPLAAMPPPFPSTTPLYLFIDGLAVLPSNRRQGIGRALLQAAERQARAWHRRSIWLHVDPNNLAAQELYQAEGYTPVSVSGWPWRQQLVMRKVLEQPQAGHQSRAWNGEQLHSAVMQASLSETTDSDVVATQNIDPQAAGTSRNSSKEQKQSVYVWGTDPSNVSKPKG